MALEEAGPDKLHNINHLVRPPNVPFRVYTSPSLACRCCRLACSGLPSAYRLGLCVCPLCAGGRREQC